MPDGRTRVTSRPGHVHASNFFTVFPKTSVKRKSRPWKLIGQLGVVEAQEMQNRGVQIVYVHAILDHVEAELIGIAQRQAGLDAAAGQPHREGVGMMVAAVVPPPWTIGVRPNSPPQITSVSSSMPRCFKSLTSAAQACRYRRILA